MPVRLFLTEVPYECFKAGKRSDIRLSGEFLSSPRCKGIPEGLEEVV